MGDCNICNNNDNDLCACFGDGWCWWCTKANGRLTASAEEMRDAQQRAYAVAEGHEADFWSGELARMFGLPETIDGRRLMLCDIEPMIKERCNPAVRDGR